MARIVTGSVAERVAPTDRQSMNVSASEPGRMVKTKSMTPMTTADRNVPARAKVNKLKITKTGFIVFDLKGTL